MTTQTIPQFGLQHRMNLALEAGSVSVQAMADLLGVTRQTVSNYLHGRSTPNLATLRVWSMRCGVPLEWLRTGDAFGDDPDPLTQDVQPLPCIPALAA